MGDFFEADDLCVGFADRAYLLCRRFVLGEPVPLHFRGTSDLRTGRLPIELDKQQTSNHTGGGKDQPKHEKARLQ
jgi:hypothetical protein